MCIGRFSSAVDTCISTVEHGAWNCTALAVLPDAILHVTLPRTYYFADLTPWNAKRHIYQLAIIYSSPTVPRPRHIAFSHLDLSVSQKNRTPPFFRNYDVRYESVTSHLACKVRTPHTYLSFLRTYYLIFPESVHRSYPLRAYCDRTCTRRLGKAHKEGGPDLKRSGRAPDL